MNIKTVTFSVMVSAFLATFPSCRADNIVFTTLHTFGTTDTERQPSTGLVKSPNGDFFGTTIGTTFVMTPVGMLTTIADFSGYYSDGDDYEPSSFILGSDGNLYFTSLGGTISRLTPEGMVTQLADLDYGGISASPHGALVQGSDGNFYGTAAFGGDVFGVYNGYVYSLTPTGTLTTLHSFGFDADGCNPSNGLVQGKDGNFYGTTTHGGATDTEEVGYGTIFQLTPTGNLTTLYQFNGTDNPDGVEDYQSQSVYSDLIQGVDGNFYGTVHYGGTYSQGEIFKVSAYGVFTVIHTFYGNPNEGYPEGSDPSGLTEGSDGNFYGTTSNGGPKNHGEIFRVTPDGALTVLYSFTGGTDGDFPYGGVVQGDDGSFYGTTSTGNGQGGTVYKITLSPTPTVTASVAGDGMAVVGGEKGRVIVQRTGDLSAPLTINYKIKGSAVASVDYKAVTGIVTIPAGAAQTKIMIKAIENDTDDGTRKAKLKLIQSTDGSYNLGSPAMAVIKIIDND